jgi:small subunit ribosomal protein S6
MNTYELTVVLPEKTTPAKKKSFVAELDKLVSSNKGKIVSTEDWGERNLAYTIKRNHSGNYLHFLLELDGSGANALKDKLRMDEGLLRILFIKSDPAHKPVSKENSGKEKK